MSAINLEKKHFHFLDEIIKSFLDIVALFRHTFGQGGYSEKFLKIKIILSLIETLCNQTFQKI